MLVDGEVWSIVRVSAAVRVLSVVALVVCAQLQQAFDTSHTLLAYSLDAHNQHGLLTGGANLLLAFVRWDTVYFVSLASPKSTQEHVGGYHLEQSLAFQPGIVCLLRWTGYVTPNAQWSPVSAILLTTLLANVATLLSPVLLYTLTHRLTHDTRFAYTAALLSILAPAAGTTLTSPTPEPFYSLAALLGLLSLESSRTCRWSIVSAALWFGVAVWFRANGVLLIGFLVWRLLFHPVQGSMRKCGSVAALVPLALLVGAPFALFQTWAYARLCEGDVESGEPEWCRARVPNAYAHVQSTYWNVGLFRYWELAQLPNFALALPVLALLAYGTFTYFHGTSVSHVAQTLRPFPPARSSSSSAMRNAQRVLTLRATPRLTPYVVHNAGVGLLLLVASHVQIALRFASAGGLPLMWWSAASLILHHPTRRRLIITYLALQYVTSIALYAGFYPPA